MKLNKEVIKDLKTDEVIALQLLQILADEHPEVLTKALEAHYEPVSADPYVNMMKVAAVSQERGRYFDDDFAELAAKEAGYFNIQGAMDAIRNVVSNVKGGVVSTVVPVGGGALNSLSDKASDNFSEAKQNIWTKIKDGVKKIFNKGNANPDLTDGNPLARNLKGMITGDGTPKPDDGKILGIPKKWFWGGLGGLVLLTIVIIVIIKMNKKKALAAAAAKAAA